MNYHRQRRWLPVSTRLPEGIELGFRCYTPRRDFTEFELQPPIPPGLIFSPPTLIPTVPVVLAVQYSINVLVEQTITFPVELFTRPLPEAVVLNTNKNFYQLSQITGKSGYINKKQRATHKCDPLPRRSNLTQ